MSTISTRIKRSCIICETPFSIPKCYEFRKYTCSSKCRNINKSRVRIGKRHNKEPRFRNCRRCETPIRINDEKRLYGKVYCSPKCQNDDHSDRLKGSNSPGWKGGVKQNNSRALFSRELYAWKIKVFVRDKHTCQHCGRKKDLEAHHIIHWADSVDKRFDVDNGLTLCIFCHGKIHNTNFSPLRKKTVRCIDCKTIIALSSKRCKDCYYRARKNSIIVNAGKNKNTIPRRKEIISLQNELQNL